MEVVVWGVIFSALIVFAFVVNRMAKESEQDSRHDTGLAIMEFGRAYPHEAIRNLHITKDANAVFVRLHDNKAGFMRNMRNHFACHLIEPGTVHVAPLPSGTGMRVEFSDAPAHNGSYEFASAKEAAEVSLWLLGNYVSASAMADTGEPVASAQR